MRIFASWVAALLIACGATTLQAADPLPSWNEGRAKQAIREFVARTTRPASPEFVPRSERIAVFDNDGTLWSEQPMYVQVRFAVDQIKNDAKRHAVSWAAKMPFKVVIDEDWKQLGQAGDKGLLEIITASHAGNTTEQFNHLVSQWLASARHPRYKRPYTELVYQPMLELLRYLQANGFKTYIVTGSGVEFVRNFSERVYGIPPEQVIGSTIETEYEYRNGQPVLERSPKIDFIDDKSGKPVAINKFIGRRPIAAFGNSDGDFEMLEWTTAGTGPRFALLVHHTDAEREVAYDRQTHYGRLDKALSEAPRRGWVVVDMMQDWGVVFPPASLPPIK